jgi:tetratricopeptide (TPR) repeat protein
VATGDVAAVPTADTLAEAVAKRYDARDFSGALEQYAAIAAPEPRTRLLAGWADFRLNRIDAAETLFREVRDRDPALWDAATGLAYCALRRNQLTAAEGGFQSVLEQHPGDIQALIGLAVTHAHAGRYDRATAALDQVLADHPDNREAHELLTTYQARIASASRR